MKFNEFFDAHFACGMPCTFDYGGESMAALFGALTRETHDDGEGFEAWERVLRHKDGNFEARLKIRKYSSTVEWWLEMSGAGAYDTRVVNNLRYADIAEAPRGKYHPSAWKFPLFHWSHGSLAQEDDFMPVSQNFTPERKHVLQCGGGRASSGCMPYFNLQLDEENGCIFAIGWNGQWRATLERQSGVERRVRVTCEMDDANFRVQNGETLILPKMLALPWEGELDESFNSFRRFIRNNILPKYDGKPLEGYVLLRAWGGMTQDIHKAKFKNVREHKLGAELYQIDAGWHGDDDTPKSDKYYFDLWGKTIGTWKPLKDVYPEGLGQMNKLCREAGMGFSVWVEPERMVSWNKAVDEHREYFIGPRLPDGVNHIELWDAVYSMMVNLGYEPAREWITNELSKVIEESSMEVLRIDFNYEPLPFWRYNDAPDRKGVSEIKYVNGVYKMLDDLLARHPGLKIDNCASGGRRLDYRMFRRSMPMICRSDYFCWQDNEPDPKQAHTYALSRWVPAHADSLGSCIGHTPERMDTYRVRSTMCSGVGMTAPWWEITEEEAAWYRKTLADAKLVREYAGLDFYPLTGYTLSQLDWMAFEFNDVENGRGIVMAFRREKCATASREFELRGIEKGRAYKITDIDLGDAGTITDGILKVNAEAPRTAKIVVYEKV